MKYKIENSKNKGVLYDGVANEIENLFSSYLQSCNMTETEFFLLFDNDKTEIIIKDKDGLTACFVNGGEVIGQPFICANNSKDARERFIADLSLLFIFLSKKTKNSVLGASLFSNAKKLYSK